MKSKSLYRFIDSSAAFEVENPNAVKGLYFPLCNEEGLLSAITPSLHGDIKLDQHSFLTLPVSLEDLHLSRASRNFWISVGSRAWSVTGESAWQKSLEDGEETSELEAGLLYHRVTRRNKTLGLESTVLNFVPAEGGTFEIMCVEVKNISKKPMSLTATSAIPFFGRSADNLRDHRHVTSLLNRVKSTPYGLTLCPTMSFNERGHHVNQTVYFVLGVDGDGRGPVGFFSTVAEFIGESGSLDHPEALTHSLKPRIQIEDRDQGQEAMGALQFKSVTLKPGETTTFLLFLGIDPSGQKAVDWVKKLGKKDVIKKVLENTKDHWKKELSKIEFVTGDGVFNNWIKWVQIQPTLRKIFGCSFLPDFDYGRGGRGWRDLWQDCLALLLANPDQVREMIRGNFAGVRIDGSNATIIGKKPVGGKEILLPEFIADRNNITRTWMDHGIWPCLTTQLYLHQTGDFDLLLEKVAYFRDAQLNRARKLDLDWMKVHPASSSSQALCLLKTQKGEPYKGSILEHILVQTLVQFFNVGEHNIIRLEDADWNDGLDLAGDRGESAAFTHMYGANLESLAEIIETTAQLRGWTHVQLAKELMMLLDRSQDTSINYDDIEEKKTRLETYFKTVPGVVSGETVSLSVPLLVKDLRVKADWIRKRLNAQEWVEAGGERWFNGYYDNEGCQVEGSNPVGRIQMTLTGQVYAIMGHTADENGVLDLIKAVNKHLYDPKLKGIRLNTNFGAPQPHLGRAFSFAYGEKENGAVFSHMVVMYANALYQRGFVDEGAKVFNSLFEMVIQSDRSQIFPGLPEYFNNLGRGRYHYLTGSASWYVHTLLTQVFGFRGSYGGLLIAPKLMPNQYDRKGEARVTAPFAGASVTIILKNPRGRTYQTMKIKSVVDEAEHLVPLVRQDDKEVLISRGFFRGKKEQTIFVHVE